MIEIRNLTKQFGEFVAVDDITFDVQPGDVLGFLGPNGAGKSTTMKMITGFLDPSQGSVRVCGHDVKLEPMAAKKRLGYLPEGAPLYPDMSVGGFLRFIAEVRGFGGSEAQAKVLSVAQKVQITEVLQQRIETLSKGFKRRVGLAQALLHDPDVLILDEPTDGLDPTQKHEVRALIREMSRDKVIVLSTHILEEVDAVCSRAIIIARGKLLFDGTPGDLVQQSAQHNYVCISLTGTTEQDAMRVMQELDGIRKVTSTEEVPGCVNLEIYPTQGENALADVSRAAFAQGWGVERLSFKRARLDEVFREITSGKITPTSSTQRERTEVPA